MKIAVLGGTGRTGLSLLHELLTRDHAVTVLVRNPAKLGDLAPRVEVLVGVSGAGIDVPGDSKSFSARLISKAIQTFGGIDEDHPTRPCLLHGRRNRRGSLPAPGPLRCLRVMMAA